MQCSAGRKSQAQDRPESFNKVCARKLKPGHLRLIQGQLVQLTLLIGQHSGKILQCRAAINLFPDLSWKLLWIGFAWLAKREEGIVALLGQICKCFSPVLCSQSCLLLIALQSCEGRI